MYLKNTNFCVFKSFVPFLEAIRFSQTIYCRCIVNCGKFASRSGHQECFETCNNFRAQRDCWLVHCCAVCWFLFSNMNLCQKGREKIVFRRLFVSQQLEPLLRSDQTKRIFLSNFNFKNIQARNFCSPVAPSTSVEKQSWLQNHKSKYYVYLVCFNWNFF